MYIFLVIGIFLIAALLGGFLASYLLTNRNTPKGVALLHGGFAASGIILLLLYAIFYHAPLLSLTLFILAALGGFFIFYLDISGRKPPKFIVLGHGLIALSAFILLLVWSFG